MAFVNNKWVAFGLGVAAGVAAVSLVKSPAFKKACAAVVGKGLQLKDDACAFAESVKEDAQDILAEAKYNNSKKAEEAKA
jgi:putative sterol carrier protein